MATTKRSRTKAEDAPESTPLAAPSAALEKLQREVGVAVDKPISAGDVMAMYRWKKADVEELGLRRFILDVREQVDMRDKIEIPNEYRAITQQMRTPFMRDTRDRVAASLVKDDPVREFTPRGESGPAAKAAYIGGKWATAMCNEMTKLGAGSPDLTHQSALDLVQDSESVIKVVHRAEAWANFPVRYEGEGSRSFLKRVEDHKRGGIVQPFASRNVDRLQMVFGDGEYGDEWCIEYGMYPVPYLSRTYDMQVAPVTQIGGRPRPEEYGGSSPLYTNSRGGFGGQMLKLEYFDARQWAVVINGEMAPGFPKENPYAPFLPYLRAVSLPALYSLRYLVPALNALLTMQMNWAYLTAYPVPVIEALAQADAMLQTLPVGDNGEAAPESIAKWKPGRAHFLPPGYTMRFLEPPSTGQALQQMISELREMIDVAGIPSVFRGIGGSRQAGYAVNQLMAAAQLTYRKLGEALGRQEEMRLDLMAHMVRHTIRQEVFVLGAVDEARRWLGIDGRPDGKAKLTETTAPVDMLGPAKVRFRPILPTDEQADAMIGLQVVNSPKQMLSQETALTRYYQIEDPQEEMDRIWSENQLNSPTLNDRILTDAMREVGMPVPSPTGAPPSAGDPGSGSFTPNDATNSGEPTVPGLTQPLTPDTSLTPGGRPAGMNPGQPGGPNLAA